MEQKFSLNVFLLLLLFFSCSKEPQENFGAESDEPQQSSPAVVEYQLDSSILIALQKETIFLNAVSIDNQKRIIEKLNLSEEKSVDRTNLLLMNPGDFTYLCKKYDCNVTPYFIFELGKTATQRLSLMVKDEEVKTKSQLDVISSCQEVKNLVISQIAAAYQWAREMNNISKDCDCTSANTYVDLAISNLEYILMAGYSVESYEYKLYWKIHQLTFGFQNDMLGMSISDVRDFVSFPNLDIHFANLKSEIQIWGNSVLPHHLSFFVTCHKTHRCPICNEIDCICKPTSPDPEYPDGGNPGGGVTPSTPCEYCGATNCTGQCITDITNIAPKAVRIFKMDRNISLSMWEQVEDAINWMVGGDLIIDYLSQALKEKINLTLSYNGGCKNVFLTNTISIRTRNSYIEGEDFMKSLFHIYQYHYYREYDMSYAMNLEFEADTYLYLSYIILSGAPMDNPYCPEFDNEEITDRYRDWAAERIFDYKNNYGMGIQASDEVDFLISYTNAAQARDPFDYKDMQVDTSKAMLRALFDFFAKM